MLTNDTNASDVSTLRSIPAEHITSELQAVAFPENSLRVRQGVSELNPAENTAIEKRALCVLDLQGQRSYLWKDQYRKEIEIVESLCKTRDLAVDDNSLFNMCSAIRFSGIKSLQDAIDLELDIIPPGPVFHTWYAYKGTTIFDGSNNDKKLNYVDRISKEASLLESWGIPLFIVYTENSMTPDQVRIMKTLFREHPNIVTLSIEQDLRETPIASSYKEQELHDYHHLDGIRGSVIMNYEKIFQALDKKANQENKTEFLIRLTALGNRSVIYSDIDNIILRKPPSVLAYSSFVGCPLFQNDAAKHIKESKPSVLSYLPHHGACRHSVDDLNEVRACSSILYDELLHLPLDTSDPIWEFDVGFYMVGHNFLRNPKNITECFLDSEGHYEHDCLKFTDVKDSNLPPLEHRATISRLHGLQLVNYLYVGQDQAWK